MKPVQLPEAVAKLYDTDLIGGPIFNFGSQIGNVDTSAITVPVVQKLLRAGCKRFWLKDVKQASTTATKPNSTSKE